MTQEEKELLLKDLCARLPYGVKVQFYLPNYQTNSFDEEIGEVFEIGDMFTHVHCKGIDYLPNTSRVKPYLRSMSSMTEEEQRHIWDKFGPIPIMADFEDAGDVSEMLRYCNMNICDADFFVDWLNEHHFDYRGLIPMGLALEAPEGIDSTQY